MGRNPLRNITFILFLHFLVEYLWDPVHVASQVIPYSFFSYLPLSFLPSAHGDNDHTNLISRANVRRFAYFLHILHKGGAWYSCMLNSTLIRDDQKKHV